MIEKITINKPNNNLYTTSDSRDGFLICLPEKCTYDDFIIAAKVEPNSYSSALLSRLYHGLKMSSINVDEEYRKYYSNEYKNLHHFLFWKYCIPVSISKKVLTDLHPGETVFYNTFSSGCSWTADAFIDNPTMMKTLKAIIDEVRRMYNENSK